MTSNDPVYSGLPFTYLASQNPTETKPPVSPNLTTPDNPYSVDDGRSPVTQGFSYLTGGTPDQPQENDYGSVYNKQPQPEGQSMIPDSNDPGWEIYQGAPHRGHGQPRLNPHSGIDRTSHLYDTVDGEHSIPRPSFRQNMAATDKNWTTAENPYSGFHQKDTPSPAAAPYGSNPEPLTPTKPRPLADDYRVNTTMGSSAGTGGCCKNKAFICVTIVVIIILSIGVGFLIGWFVKDVFEDDESTGQ